MDPTKTICFTPMLIAAYKEKEEENNHTEREQSFVHPRKKVEFSCTSHF
jgi:hypothetical protein